MNNNKNNKRHSMAEITADDDEQTIKNKMKEIIAWSNGQSAIADISEKSARLFLHSCFYNVDQTKATLTAYYGLRTKAPEYFTSRDPSLPNLIEASKIAYTVLLPGTTDEGYRVILMGYFHTDTSKYVFNDVMKRFMMIVDMWLSKSDTCPGYYFLIDCKNSVFTHFTSASFDSLRKFCLYFQEALPVRLQAVIFINISPAVDMLLNVVRPILSKRLVTLIHKFQRGSDEYLKMVPKRMLPEDYGGEYKSIKEMQDDTQHELLSYAEWFAEQDQIIRTIAEKQISDNNRGLFGVLF